MIGICFILIGIGFGLTLWQLIIFGNRIKKLENQLTQLTKE